MQIRKAELVLVGQERHYLERRVSTMNLRDAAYQQARPWTSGEQSNEGTKDQAPDMVRAWFVWTVDNYLHPTREEGRHAS